MYKMNVILTRNDFCTQLEKGFWQSLAELCAMLNTIMQFLDQTHNEVCRNFVLGFFLIRKKRGKCSLIVEICIHSVK